MGRFLLDSNRVETARAGEAIAIEGKASALESR